VRWIGDYAVPLHSRRRRLPGAVSATGGMSSKRGRLVVDMAVAGEARRGTAQPAMASIWLVAMETKRGAGGTNRDLGRLESGRGRAVHLFQGLSSPPRIYWRPQPWGYWGLIRPAVFFPWGCGGAVVRLDLCWNNMSSQWYPSCLVVWHYSGLGIRGGGPGRWESGGVAAVPRALVLADVLCRTGSVVPASRVVWQRYGGCFGDCRYPVRMTKCFRQWKSFPFGP
jgi:hypothetical protein